MEKVGLIATSFTERVREICDGVEKLSDGKYRIGYCYSLDALKMGEEHTDFGWAKDRGAHFPDRLQEVLRNCDLFLTVQTESKDVSTLPLMTAKGTFVLTDGVADSELIKRLEATAEEYGTKMGYGDIGAESIIKSIIEFYGG